MTALYNATTARLRDVTPGTAAPPPLPRRTAPVLASSYLHSSPPQPPTSAGDGVTAPGARARAIAAQLVERRIAAHVAPGSATVRARAPEAFAASTRAVNYSVYGSDSGLLAAGSSPRLTAGSQLVALARPSAVSSTGPSTADTTTSSVARRSALGIERDPARDAGADVSHGAGVRRGATTFSADAADVAHHFSGSVAGVGVGHAARSHGSPRSRRRDSGSNTGGVGVASACSSAAAGGSA